MLKKRLTILLFLAAIFFFVYSYLNFQIPLAPQEAGLNPPLEKGEAEGDFKYPSLTKGETKGDFIFNSPDETSAYFFSRLFADSPTKLPARNATHSVAGGRNGYENYKKLESGGLHKLESLNFLAPGLIHPRSVLVNSTGYLVPGSFLGMPLIYGSLAKIPLIPPFIKGETKGDFGVMAIPFFTPLFAVLGVLALYFLLRKIWDENTAFLSAVLMFFLPPFWYYSTRGMFPNILFVSLLIISAGFLFCVPHKRINADGNADKSGKLLEHIRYIGGGLFLGLALITRTSEIVWVGILGLGLAVYFWRRICWPAAILGIAALCATFLPVFYQNQMLYGSIVKSGYNINLKSEIRSTKSETILNIQNLNVQNSVGNWKLKIENLLKMVFPFGFHPRLAWNSFLNYYFKFFWWFTIPTLLGCLIFLYQNFCVVLRKVPRSSAIKSLFSSPQILYFLSFGFVSVWLLFYYGSWRFSDNINFQKITVGNSYLRYWLPIFIMGLPFVAIFLKKMTGILFYLSKKRTNLTSLTSLTCLTTILFFMFFMSALSVFAGEDEGIFYVKKQLLRYNETKQAVLKLTEENSIIITERSDKIFFPDRRVIVWKRGEALDENFKNLSKFAPLYYYNIAFTNKEFETFNQELSKLDFRLELVKVFGNEALYKLIPKSESRIPK